MSHERRSREEDEENEDGRVFEECVHEVSIMLAEHS
jgi:hypothetical protein